jgi:WD40 repeat protein
VIPHSHCSLTRSERKRERWTLSPDFVSHKAQGYFNGLQHLTDARQELLLYRNTGITMRAPVLIMVVMADEQEVPICSRKINTLSLEPLEGRVLAVAGGDGSLTLWDIRKLDAKAEAVAAVKHSKTCLSAYFAPDGEIKRR